MMRVFVCVLLGEEREMEKVHKMCELTVYG